MISLVRPQSRVAGIIRNGWPLSPGIGGRNGPEYAPLINPFISMKQSGLDSGKDLTG